MKGINASVHGVAKLHIGVVIHFPKSETVEEEFWTRTIVIHQEDGTMVSIPLFGKTAESLYTNIEGGAK